MMDEVFDSEVFDRLQEFDLEFSDLQGSGFDLEIPVKGSTKSTDAPTKGQRFVAFIKDHEARRVTFEALEITTEETTWKGFLRDVTSEETS